MMTAASWLDIPSDSPFPITNLPYGVVSYPDSDGAHVGVAVGDYVVDLAAMAALGLFDGVIDEPHEMFASANLNAFMANGPAAWKAVRARLQDLLIDPQYRAQVEPELVPRDRVVNHLPIEVADYVDFYSSEQHAKNVGAIFRPDSPALPANWKHLPIGYHGRSGTIVVSGTPISRPHGQRKAPDAEAPSYGPSNRLDIEAEVGFVVGAATALGSSVTPGDLTDYVFGVVLVNDWSARDIQAWEYVPLGPFLGKSFATSISPWVVPLDALKHARVALPEQQPSVLPYLRDDDAWCLDIHLEVNLNGTTVSQPPFATQYWSPGQQLAHLTVNGASLRVGDLFASGTVTGPERDQRGSFLELSWGGREPFTLDDGSQRTFLVDGDAVSITGWAPGPDGTRIGFGSVDGVVAP